MLLSILAAVCGGRGGGVGGVVMVVWGCKRRHIFMGQFLFSFLVVKFQ